MFGYSEVVHRKEEWGELKVDRCTRDWSFGKGGHGFEKETYTISIPEGNGDVWHIWEVPPALCKLLEIAEKIAAEQALRKARMAFQDFMNVLGIED